MATIRKNWSYDDEEDADVHQFLQNLPQRHVSKYIRIALRMLMKEMEGGNENSSNGPTPPRTLQKTDERKERKSSEKEETNKTVSNYLDVNDIIKNLGK